MSSVAVTFSVVYPAPSAVISIELPISLELPISIIPVEGTFTFAVAASVAVLALSVIVKFNSPSAYPTPCLITSILSILPPTPIVTRNSATCDDIIVASVLLLYPSPFSVIVTGVVLLIPPAGTVIVADAAIIGVILT